MSGAPTPTVIGRYAVFDRIAAGGMATVHLGRLLGEGGFTRTVAIKRLHPQYALDPSFVAMFLDEARLCARIRHPNVVPTLDVVSRDDQLMLVMEYVEGESLSSLWHTAKEREQSLPTAHVVSIITGALHGLHAAHEANGEDGAPLGIVHRDVSPQNILVGVDGVARVLDFGIAKALGQLHTTTDGMVKGKFGYMAPEHVKGEEVTRRTDLFAIAVVLWEALAMRRLYRADNDVRRIHLILNETPPLLREIAPDIPPALEAVVARGLEKDPARRFATALEMVEALEEAMAPSTARAVGAWVREVADERLATRAATVADVERSSQQSAMKAPPDSAPSSTPSEPTLQKEAAPAPQSFVPEGPPSQASQLSTLSVSRPTSERPPAPRMSLLIGGIIAGGVVLCAVIIGVVSVMRQPSKPPSLLPPEPVSFGATGAPASATNEEPPPPAASASTNLKLPPSSAANPPPRRPATTTPPPPPPAAKPQKQIYSRD
jgi:eukaryotic-like serine/threonine-protein kinase